MKKLELNQMEQINGESFCATFGATTGIYALGAKLSLWPGIGWGGLAVIAAIGVGCAIYHYD